MEVSVRINDGTTHMAPPGLRLFGQNIKEDGNCLLLNINKITLDKIIEFMEHYNTLPARLQKLYNTPERLVDNEEELNWSKQYGAMSLVTLSELVNVSHNHFKQLVNLCCYLIAKQMKDKSPEQINNELSIHCDLGIGELEELEEDSKYLD